MKRVLIGVVVVGLIFLWSGFSFANGAAPKEVKGESVSQVKPRTGELKSPGFATLLSVLVPGLGQVYNNDLAKALVMFGAEGICWIMIGNDIEELGLFGIGIGRFISGVDAYYGALKKNEGLSLNIDNEKVIIAIKRQF